jgi:hypothetical protein
VCWERIAELRNAKLPIANFVRWPRLLKACDISQSAQCSAAKIPNSAFQISQFRNFAIPQFLKVLSFQFLELTRRSGGQYEALRGEDRLAQK